VPFHLPPSTIPERRRHPAEVLASRGELVAAN
jgi:hypothetical protein